jgi:hypothetical protein
MYPLCKSTLFDVDSLLIILLCLFLSNSGCVDYIFNNLSAFFDYLHSCKIFFIFLFFSNH